MTKKDALRLLMTLSALESWSFSVEKSLPDYLIESLEYHIDKLTEELLEEQHETVEEKPK